MRRSALELALGVRFKDRDLLEQALVHPSYVNEVRPGEKSPATYERLEFLGDAVLGVAVAAEIYRRGPELSEGELTRLRSSLVRDSTLTRVARVLFLGEHLTLGKGEEASGGRERDSNLAAAFEAVVGAVFLDRGFESAATFALGAMSLEMEGLLAKGVPQDDKSRLQELSQRMGKPPPEYKLVGQAGLDHARSFQIEVMMDGQVMGKGSGGRKADAEKRAAGDALKRLELADSPGR